MPETHAPDKPPLTRIQALYFELIRTIRYNELDGGRVVDQLLEWRCRIHVPRVLSSR